ncbi:MAG: hypothetical protein H8D67_17010 [Deltaproteobacteria bacterium]|nr:hypothetical protein [Deltaproteobacteria bacterium]MBL7075780.1 hypothetical protein [candidate division KSB1 bacterium]
MYRSSYDRISFIPKLREARIEARHWFFVARFAEYRTPLPKADTGILTDKPATIIV